MFGRSGLFGREPDGQSQAPLPRLRRTASDRRRRRAGAAGDVALVRQIAYVRRDRQAPWPKLRAQLQQTVRALALDGVVERREKDRALPARADPKRERTEPARAPAPFEPETPRPFGSVGEPVAGDV